MMYRKYSDGLIEIITGPMFAGKSEELIKRIRILGYAKIKTLVIKPAIGDRWSKEKIVSRSGDSATTITVEKANDILGKWDKSYRAVAIDEVQFFDKTIVDVALQLVNKGVHVIISGLDQNYLTKPFGAMPELLAIADRVDKLAAVCFVCGNAASTTFRKTDDQALIQVGDKEYEARCRTCHRDGLKSKLNH